jgi:hypothetical protein
VDYIDVYVDGVAIAYTYAHSGGLAPQLAFKRSRNTVHLRGRECGHEDVRVGFAYSRASDENWPIAYCDTCRAILRGREPDAFTSERSPAGERAQVRAGRSWGRDWPKPGRPRSSTPPLSTLWPEAA